MKPTSLEIHIPSFNEEGNILRFLKSLQSQTYEKFRAIIHDNGSTDRTVEICNEFCKDDCRFEVDSIPVNIHVINQLIRIKFSPRADYVGQLSVNDLIAPNYVEELMDTIAGDERIGLVYSHGYLTDLSDNSEQDPGFDCAFDTRQLSMIDAANQVVARYTHAFALWGIYRRSVLEKCRPMQFVFGGDHIFIAEVALYSKIARISKRLNWRTNGHSTQQAGVNHNILIQLEEHTRGIHPDSFFYGLQQQLPFLNMIWGHAEMYSLALIDEKSKYILIESAVNILYERFSSLIDREIDSFILHCESIIRTYSSIDLNSYDKKILLFWHKKIYAELCKVMLVSKHSGSEKSVKVIFQKFTELTLTHL